MVRLQLEELVVHFPYDFIYPEQYAYMIYLKRILDAKGHGVLEMPTGTGKTVSLFSLITSYQLAHPSTGKLIYCTRTVPEMEKALLELRRVMEYRIQEIEKEERKKSSTLSSGTSAEGERAEKSPVSSFRPAPRSLVPIDTKLAATGSAEKFAEMHRAEALSKGYILAVGLSARRNMCVHPDVAHLADREKIDEHCRKLTAPWIRQKLLFTPHEESEISDNPLSDSIDSVSVLTPDIEDLVTAPTSNASPSVLPDYPRGLCGYYENFERHWTSQQFPWGVFTIEDIKHACSTWKHPRLGKVIPTCPYFTARRLIQVANVIVLNYQYILDPKVSQVTNLGANVGRAAPTTASSHTRNFLETAMGDAYKEPSIIVFDEAHNIDNVCIEALSVTLNRSVLEGSGRNLIKLSDEIQKTKQIDQQRLNEEYGRLVRGLHASGELDTEMFEHLANPVLPADVMQEAIPGNIRRAEHFLNAMKKVVLYLKTYMNSLCVHGIKEYVLQYAVEYPKIYEIRSEGPLTFLHAFEQATEIDRKTLKFCYDRLKSLLNTLQVTNVDEFSPLNLVAGFCTLVATYWEGFVLICDPYPEATGLYDPLLQLCCLDASLAIKPVLQRYQSIILTSGTISPLELYPKLLDFTPVVTESLPMSLDRNCICPIIVSRGADQVPLSSRYELRNDLSVIQNYGNLLIELCKTVPDGMVLPPRFYSSDCIRMPKTKFIYWYEMGVLATVMEYKLIFIETKDVVATTLALQNYRRACDCGRGAVFFSVARGKVAEGIDFDRHYGRCVVLFGVPFQYTLSRILKARLDFMREHYQIQENEFLTFDAMRQAAQCVGRVIRSKADYGLMVFADSRYCRLDKRSKLPPWIQKFLENSHLALTTETAISVAKTFFKNMSQPYKATHLSLLDTEILLDPKRTHDVVIQSLSLKNTLIDIGIPKQPEITDVSLNSAVRTVTQLGTL
ncbi:Dna excision repair helicase [Cardiosporidium cionae]|uniref:DNA 5'-3' helicase n=1 Tax=Cardiosporidium cionae TaxID=476202 RepID=A0ABQ7JBG2_9APIC|nr:Dna excision repair helicase [Cardiosporidium cionae]|eukprot:KAF8821311.1 Dna excision repair helicase [Cardiosporidium cionae]